MALTLATADAVLKEDYHGPVVEQLNNANVLLAMVQRDSESLDSGGRRFIHPIHTKRNRGRGARAESAVLPTGGNQEYQDAIGPLRYLYGAIEITGQAIEHMMKNKHAFLRAVDSEVDGILRDVKRDMCRQLWGTSDGVLASCGTTSASTTVALATTTTEKQLRDLDEDITVDIGADAEFDDVATDRNITSVDFDAKTCVISGAAVTTDSSDRIVIANAGGTSDDTGNPGDGQKELTGLQTIVDATEVLHTLDPATVTKWKSREVAHDAAISENVVNRTIMRTEIDSGEVVDILITSDGVFAAYANELKSLKRFMDDALELRGGYTALRVGTAEMGSKKGTKLGLCWDRDCPNGELYGLNWDAFRMWELTDWDWIDQGGGRILTQKVDTNGRYDVYQGQVRKYCEFGAVRRNSHFKITGITEAA